MSTRGFKEMAAVSHLGPAIATLARMKELDEHGSWRSDAEALLDSTRSARLANSPDLWRDGIAVAAFVGREAAIAAMIDYSCRSHRADAGTSARRRRVPDRRARFAPTTSTVRPRTCPSRSTGSWWRRSSSPAWTWRTGSSGGSTGSTSTGSARWSSSPVGSAGRRRASHCDSHSVAEVIFSHVTGSAARSAISLIAPHAPVFSMFDGTNIAEVAALEHEYRLLWSRTIATCDLGELMFSGYPRFEPQPPNRRPLSPRCVVRRGDARHRQPVGLAGDDHPAPGGARRSASTAVGSGDRLRQPAADRRRQ